MIKDTWIVVANGTQARFFRLDKLRLVEMEAMIHPESRMREHEYVEQKPGATHQGGGTGNPGIGHGIYSTEQQTPPKKVEAINFAKEVAARLDNVRSKGKLERLYVAASPAFLGLLRQELDQRTTHLVAAEVAKDITHLRAEEILPYFPIGL